MLDTIASAVTGFGGIISRCRAPLFSTTGIMSSVPEGRGRWTLRVGMSGQALLAGDHWNAKTPAEGEKAIS